MLAAAAIATPRVLLAWRVAPRHAENWARGILTDFAMKLAEERDGAALFIAEIEGAAAWRDLAALIAAKPPNILIFRARSPVIDARARRYGCRPWHRDEWANRYHVSGAILARFLSDLTRHAQPASL